MAKICFDVDKLEDFLKRMTIELKYTTLRLISNQFEIAIADKKFAIPGVVLYDDIVNRIDNIDKTKIILELLKIEEELDVLKTKIESSIEFPDINK